MKFDEKLRNLRKEKDFSQEYLAEKMNVSRQTISKWENGTAMPDLKKLTELANLFNTSMDELLGTSAPAPSVEPPQFDTAQIDDLKAQLHTYQVKSKRMNIILFVAIIILMLALIISNSNLNSSIEGIWNSIYDINSRLGQVMYTNDSDDSILNDIEYFISAVDKENPHIVEMTFKYSPASYVKGSRVSVIVNEDNDSKSKTFYAEQVGKVFVVKAKIELSQNREVDLSIDDGTNVKTESLEIDMFNLYQDFVDFEIHYRKEELDNNKTRIVFEVFDEASGKIKWINHEELPKIKDASINVMLENGAVINSQALDIKTEDDMSFVEPFSSININGDFYEVAIVLRDENDVIYSIKCGCTNGDDTVGISMKFPNGLEMIMN